MKSFVGAVRFCPDLMPFIVKISVNEPESVTVDSDEDIAELDATEENLEPDFPELDDANLLLYVENTVYSDLIDQSDGDDYFVEIYIQGISGRGRL